MYGILYDKNVHFSCFSFLRDNILIVRVYGVNFPVETIKEHKCQIMISLMEVAVYKKGTERSILGGKRKVISSKISDTKS